MLDLDDAGFGGQLAAKAQQTGVFELALLPEGNRFRLKAGVKVVAVRIDPCSQGHPGKECTKELRLVLQPIGAPGEIYGTSLKDPATGRAVRITAMNYFGYDQVMHYIYELTDDDFARLTDDLKRLKALAKQETACLPLSVHPVMAKQGLGGEYATALKALVQAYAGEANLDRVAITAERGFSLFDIVDFNWFMSMLNKEEGFGFTNQSTPGFLGNLGLTPEAHRANSVTISKTSLGTLVFMDAATSLNQTSVNTALKETLMVDNPKLSNPETIDCVSCHLAERLRDRALKDPRVMVNPSIWTDLYTNPAFDLTPTSDGNGIGSLRMFGYMNEDVHITQRVVNDSAESAQKLNDMN